MQEIAEVRRQSVPPAEFVLGFQQCVQVNENKIKWCIGDAGLLAFVHRFHRRRHDLHAYTRQT